MSDEQKAVENALRTQEGWQRIREKQDTFMNRRIALLVLVCLVFTGLGSVSPSRHVFGMEEILERGELRILLAEGDWWPFFYTDETGELAGIDIELAHLISQELKVRPVFIQEGTFTELAESLRAGRGDVIISYYSYTPERSSQIYLTEPYVIESDGVLVHIQTVEQARRISTEITPERLIQVLDRPDSTIGSFIGTTYAEWVRELFPQAEILLFDQADTDQVLNEKAVDALYLPEYWSRFFLASHPQYYMNYQFVPLQKTDRIAIGVAPDQLNLYLWLEKYMTYTYDVQTVLDQMYDRLASELEPLIGDPASPRSLVPDPYRGILVGLLFLAGGLAIRHQQKKIQLSLNGQKPPHWLLNMWTVIFAMAAGLVTGIVFPEISGWIGPLGDLFFNYLLLAGIPILFCVVFINFFKLISCMGGALFLRKFAIILFLFYIMGSLLGTLAGTLGQPGSGLSLENQQRLAEAIHRQSEEVLDTTVDFSPGAMFWLLTETMVPDSALRAFMENRTLAILFFALLCAFALHFMNTVRKNRILEIVETVNELFMFLFRLSYYILPVGLFALMLSQAQIFVENSGLFSAFINLTILQVILVLVWFGIALGIGCWKTGLKPGQYLSMLKKPLMIAFSLLSTLAALPASIEVVENRPEFRDSSVRGAFPLVYLMLDPAMASLFALVTIFLIQLVGIEMTSGSLLFIVFAAVAGGLATSGIPAPVFLFAISIVILPFGIPVSHAVFFMLPWTLIGSRIEIINYVLLNFGVSLFFKQKEVPPSTREAWEEGRKGGREDGRTGWYQMALVRSGPRASRHGR